MVGPTRINADGTIARFPVITAAERVEAVNTMGIYQPVLHFFTPGRVGVCSTGNDGGKGSTMQSEANELACRALAAQVLTHRHNPLAARLRRGTPRLAKPIKDFDDASAALADAAIRG